MKAKEIFLIFAAFTLSLMTFCVVALTGSYSDKCANTPIPPLGNSSETAGTNRTFIHNSTHNLNDTAQKIETKQTHPVANKHPGKSKTNARSSDLRMIDSEDNNRLKPIKYDGRVYLEDISGIEACESNNDDESRIESIE